MPTVEFHGVRCYLERAKYRNGQTALILRHDGEDYAMASVALHKMHPEGCVWVKDYSENVGMKDALVAAGVIAPEAVESVQSGFVTVSAYRLLA